MLYLAKQANKIPKNNITNKEYVEKVILNRSKKLWGDDFQFPDGIENRIKKEKTFPEKKVRDYEYIEKIFFPYMEASFGKKALDFLKESFSINKNHLSIEFMNYFISLSKNSWMDNDISLYLFLTELSNLKKPIIIEKKHDFNRSEFKKISLNTEQILSFILNDEKLKDIGCKNLIIEIIAKNNFKKHQQIKAIFSMLEIKKVNFHPDLSFFDLNYLYGDIINYLNIYNFKNHEQIKALSKLLLKNDKTHHIDIVINLGKMGIKKSEEINETYNLFKNDFVVLMETLSKFKTLDTIKALSVIFYKDNNIESFEQTAKAFSEYNLTESKQINALSKFFTKNVNIFNRKSIIKAFAKSGFTDPKIINSASKIFKKDFNGINKVQIIKKLFLYGFNTVEKIEAIAKKINISMNYSDIKKLIKE